jgi:hypothetical protein
MKRTKRRNKMKKFVLLTYGYETPTPEIQEAWGKWFALIGNKMVDPGSPLGHGKEISTAGTQDLPMGLESLTGYCIINADSFEEAETIAKACPMITSIRVYEAGSM